MSRTPTFDIPRGAADVLLHACCAPCSGALLEWMLQQGLHPTVFFANDNIYPDEEYRRRRDEARRYAESLGAPFVEAPYDHAAWLAAVAGLEDEPERGRRCERCFRYRLDRAASYAAAYGHTLVATTLATSRWKNLEQVNAAGTAAADAHGISFWAQNWRRGGLQERRAEVLREQGFYNQTYCGCEFSLRHADD